MAIETPLQSRNGQKPTSRTIEIKPLEVTRFAMTLQGTTPLICDAFSEERRRRLESTQTGVARDKLSARRPDQEFEDALYRLPDGRYGFPKLGVRKAIAVAATRMSDTKGTEMLAAFMIDTPDEYLALDAAEPEMRRDHVTRMGRANLAYRAQFYPWSLSVPVKLHEPIVTLNEFIDIVSKAGIGVGIGNWRPEKKGDFGTFEVVEVVGR